MGYQSHFLFPDESHAIIGAAMHVHSVLGCGFKESVYQEALEIEFRKRGIPYEIEKRLPVYYDGLLLNQVFVIDFLCFNQIVVELKAVTTLLGEFKAQTINYLKAGNFPLGYLINFGNEEFYRERLFPPRQHKPSNNQVPIV